MTTIIINGALGKMGRFLASCAVELGFPVIAGIDKYAAGAKLSFPLFESLGECNLDADVLIDFSRPDALDEILAYGLSKGIALVLATTGYSAEQNQQILEASRQIPIFKTANMSIGVNVLLTLAQKAALDLRDFDIEIIEKHHNTKVDAPSGTALLLADGIQSALSTKREYVFGRQGVSKRESDEIGIHAIRGGNMAGDHDILFLGNDEILTLAHHSASRRIYAVGALKAAQYISGCRPGIHDMQDLLLQNAGVTSIRSEQGQAFISIDGMGPAQAAQLFSALADMDINIDMIAQSRPGDALSFTMEERDAEKAASILKGAKIETGVVKLTAVGLGMEKQRGIAAGIFKQVAELKIEPLLVTTSETQVSMLMTQQDAQMAAVALKKAYSA